MFLKTIAVCILFFVCNFIYICYSDTPENYGPFTLSIIRAEICKGPKRSDCCVNVAKVENRRNLVLDMDIKKNVIPNRGKIVVMVNGKILVRLQMKKPCDHLFLKPLFMSLFNITPECEFQKGQYHLNIDIDNTAQSYYGGMFFYGNLTFKTVLYNEECNFFCIAEEVTLYPKSTSLNIKH